MLEIGVDSYVTVAEADAYSASHYLSTDKVRLEWEKLSTEDKEVILRQSCLEMDALPYVGRKVSETQTLAFPRMKYGYCMDGVDPYVAKAQVEQALSKMDTTQAKRKKLQKEGVKSYSIGDLSETYSDAVVSGFAVASAKQTLCEKSRNYLSDWLRGGYRVG